MINEAAQCTSDEDVHLDIDDVIEFIGDTVPHVLSVSTCTSTTESTGKLPQNVTDMLQKLVDWMKNKQKFEVSHAKNIHVVFLFIYVAKVDNMCACSRSRYRCMAVSVVTLKYKCKFSL